MESQITGRRRDLALRNARRQISWRDLNSVFVFAQSGRLLGSLVELVNRFATQLGRSRFWTGGRGNQLGCPRSFDSIW